MKAALFSFALASCIFTAAAQNTPPILSSVNTPSIAAGYTPGTLYNMAVNFNENSNEKAFTLKISNGTNTGETGYLTQLAATLDTFTEDNALYITTLDTTSVGAWLFKWTTPASGGNITLELIGAAFNLGSGLDEVVHTCNYQLTTSSFGLSGNCTNNVVGVWEREENFIHVQAYPNPSSGKITISYSLLASENTVVELLDLNGKMVREIFSGRENSGISTHAVNTDDLAAGLYVARVTIGKKVGYNKISVR